MTETPKVESEHWIVRTNYQNRTSAFVMLFAIVGAQMAAASHGLLAWLGPILLFLVYPHLAYWRARRSASPRRVELNNLLLDSFLFGICAAALGFPLWIGFTLLIGTTITHVLYLGISGVLRSFAAMGLGVLVSLLLLGWRPTPDTEPAATVLCVVGLMLYLLSLANLAYLRTLKLRESRQKLHQNDQALQQTNAALQAQLDQVRSLQAQLSDQANRDPLTGLYNRRFLDSAMLRELARCEREGHVLSLILLDIDHFKRINDNFGHAAGDQVLKQLALLLSQDTRASDVVCRFGGEEFLVILPHTSLAITYERAEHWRLSFAAQTRVHEGQPIQATVSMGIASYPEHGKTQEVLVRCADLALYQAKSGGRNQTVLYQPPPPPADPRAD
jgi:diguanylate cyclase (GGDEF)-like protein